MFCELIIDICLQFGGIGNFEAMNGDDKGVSGKLMEVYLKQSCNKLGLSVEKAW